MAKTAIGVETTYALLKHAGSRSTITRSPAQKSACKDLGRNGQSPTITPKATYTPTSNRAGSRSLLDNNNIMHFQFTMNFMFDLAFGGVVDF